MPERLDQTLLDHIRYGHNDEAKSMLNAELAQAAPVLEHDPNYYGTLLHFAVEHNNSVIARRLVELGADVNLLRGYGMTPLTKALLRQCAAVVHVLLEAGARVDMIEEDGTNALQEALDCFIVNTETFELFARKLRTEARTNDELAETLIKAGCNMCHAASLGDIDLLECMLKRGVDVSSKDSSEMTALHAAVKLNDVSMANWLLDNGVDVEATDEIEWSALEMSVKVGTETMTQFLTAHLAMLEMLGIPVDKSVMYSEDDRYQTEMFELRKYYEQCQEVLTIKVFEEWSLLDLLNVSAVSERKVRFLARKEKFFQEVQKVSSKRELNESYSKYYNTMIRRIEANYNYFYIFARGVVEYLNELDLENLVRV